MTRRERLQHLIRAKIVGGEALAVQAAAQVLYQAGGKKVLSETAQEAVREISEQGAMKLVSRALPEVETLAARAATPALGGGRRAALALGSGGSRALSRTLARSAAKQVLRGAGRAAAFGFAIDGAIGGAEAYVGYRRGSLSGKQALAHAGTEAATGALASAAGVAAAAGLIAVTGGLAAPVVFAVGAGGAILTKVFLTRVLRPRSSG